MQAPFRARPIGSFLWRASPAFYAHHQHFPRSRASLVCPPTRCCRCFSPSIFRKVGNEPEGFNGAEGLRPHNWSPRDFAREFSAHASALAAAGMPTVPPRLQGFVLGGNDSAFNAFWPNFTAEFAPQLASVSRHHYALDGCGSGAPPSVWDLLATDPSFLRPYAAAAASARVPFVVGEANSVSCGGLRGVSDVFGAALWALDFLLGCAALNASQVNMHGGPHNAYSVRHRPTCPHP